MLKVNFYDTAEDQLLKFAVIIAKKDGEWIFCKHRERDTFEFPGGHREEGESIDEAARRELYEETGAIDFDLTPICAYSVVRTDEEESFGMLYFADVKVLEEELHSEIEKIIITERFPEKWTYPLIQPHLLEEARRRGFC